VPGVWIARDIADLKSKIVSSLIVPYFLIEWDVVVNAGILANKRFLNSAQHDVKSISPEVHHHVI